MTNSTKKISPQNDWKREEAKIKREIMMVANEFASSSPKSTKKKKRSKKSKSKRAPTQEKAEKKSPNKSSPTPKVRAGEKIRFVRLPREATPVKIQKSRNQKVPTESDDDTNSSTESPILLIRGNKHNSKNGEKSRKKSVVVEKTPRTSKKDSADKNAANIQAESKVLDSCNERMVIPENNRHSCEKNQAGMQENDAIAPIAQEQEEESVWDEVTVYEDDDDDFENSSGWGTDSNDDSSIELEAEEGFSLHCHDMNGSNPSLLTESTVSLTSRGGLHDSSFFNASTTSLLLSPSPSPLSLGPKAFLEANTMDLRNGLQSGKLSHEEPSVDVSETKAKEVEFIASEVRKETGDTLPDMPSSINKGSEGSATELDADSEHSVVSAPGTTKCDLDQLMPFLKQDVKLTSVMKEQKRYKGTRSHCVQLSPHPKHCTASKLEKLKPLQENGQCTDDSADTTSKDNISSHEEALQAVPLESVETSDEEEKQE